MTEPEPIPKIHLLENPAVWLALQALEFGLFLLVYTSVVPDGWPVSVKAVASVAFLAALVAGNIWLRRRFIPR